MSFSWGRSRRLRGERTIRLVYDQGTRVKFARGALFFCEAEDLKVAISISRKTGNAPVRNRQKRLVREFFRLHQHRFAKPFWIMVVMYTPYETIFDLSRDLEALCCKAGLWQ